MDLTAPAVLDMSGQARDLADAAINGYQWINSGGALDLVWFAVFLMLVVGIVWSLSHMLTGESSD